MLSKVVKGEGARVIQAMSFRAALPAVNELSKPPAKERSASNEEQSALLDKIRALEGELAESKRAAFDAGCSQGEQKARSAVTPVIERLNSSIAETIGMRPELRRRAEKDAVDLALQIARRVLHRELSVDPNALNALARVVFDRLARAESWQLTVHPQFAEAIRGSLPAAGLSKVRVEADPSCAPGTLIARCADGVIDASVDSQLSEISQGLTDRLTRK
jgi:flagellar assembly protein FliH